MPRGRTTKQPVVLVVKATTTQKSQPAKKVAPKRAASQRKAPTGTKKMEKMEVAENRKRKRNEESNENISVKKTKTNSASTLVKETKINHHSHRKQPGQVFVMGQGDTGQLGLGEDIIERGKPCPVDGTLDGLSIVDLVCGGMHTVALTDGGKVFTWGCNDEGALGRAINEGEEFSPGVVLGLTDVVQLAAGDSHTVALTAAGDVYCWGVFRDSNGPFGLVQPNTPAMLPMKTYSCHENRAVKIASGCSHVAVLTEDGSIVTFGCAEQGQLGRVHEAFSHRGGRKGVKLLLEPQLVRFRKPKPIFVDVFCGSYHTFALAEDGLYTWGLNNYGQIGTNDTISRFQPEKLPADWISSSDVKENRKANHTSSSASGKMFDGVVMSGGQHHTVLCHQGVVYVMGRREYGRLGLGENNSEEPSTPRRVPELEKIVQIAAGNVCSFAVNDSGDLYSWGMGTNLQLGTGQEEDLWKPGKVKGKKLDGKKVVCVSAGGQHTGILAAS